MFSLQSLLVSYTTRSPQEQLESQMSCASSYQEWLGFARELDIVMGGYEWKNNPVSIHYDYDLIQRRLQNLEVYRNSKNIAVIKDIIRSGLLRNLAGIHHPQLFSRSLLGTKKLIEDYLDQVVSQLHYVCDEDFEDFSTQSKVDFFCEIRQTFGTSALLLEGGSTFGLYHLGVVKTLLENNCLPRIVCGSSIGSLIAALVCIHTDDELPAVFLPGGIDLKAFAKKSNKGNLQRKLTRLLKHGHLLDVKVLEDCVRSNVGELTFEEAYLRTKRILNINVASSRKNEVPCVLNYLTAPKVLIWSAACASCANYGLYNSVDLLAKDKSGNIVPWNLTSIKWSDTYYEPESVQERLSELFNVNHFISSTASQLVAPFISSLGAGSGVETWMAKIVRLLSNEVKHRVNQLGYFGLIPRPIQVLLERQYQGHVTIEPHLTAKDTYTIFSNPTYASLNHWILKGEQATWPVLATLKSRLKVEFAYEACLQKLKDRLTNETVKRTQTHEEAKAVSRVSEKIKRTRSIN